MSEPLIHPGCLNPEYELMNHVNRLTTSASEAGLSDEVIAEILRGEAESVESDA